MTDIEYYIDVPEIGKIFSQIFDAMKMSIAYGYSEPTEIWLGPREMKALNPNSKTIMGLTIREMKNDGVRVGATW